MNNLYITSNLEISDLSLGHKKKSYEVNEHTVSMLKILGSRISGGAYNIREGNNTSLSRILLCSGNNSKKIDPIAFEIKKQMDNYIESLFYLSKIDKLNIETLNLINKVIAPDCSSSGKLRTVKNHVKEVFSNKIVYTPPKASLAKNLLIDLVDWINSQEPSLGKALFSHIQFSNIHPYADGNGRLSRLLFDSLTEEYLGFYFPFSIYRLGRSKEYISLYDTIYDRKSINLNIKFWLDMIKWFEHLLTIANLSIEKSISETYKKIPVLSVNNTIKEIIESSLSTPLIMVPRNTTILDEYNYLSEIGVLRKFESKNYKEYILYRNEEMMLTWTRMEESFVNSYKIKF